jgi:hypothetical protein
MCLFRKAGGVSSNINNNNKTRFEDLDVIEAEFLVTFCNFGPNL